MYLYETHLHTRPVSRCACASVEEVIRFYKKIGYEGIFITNHFIDGNINAEPSCSYEERINFFFSDYEEGVRVGQEIGLSVFCGIEMSYRGTDFLVYGLGKDWFLAHPEIESMQKTEQLKLLSDNGALIIHAHPFREASYIDHIRLFPRNVHGVEIFNANRTDFENDMAKLYAEKYGLLKFAGSDNHSGERQSVLGGMQTDTPIKDEHDFIERVRNKTAEPFCRNTAENKGLSHQG